MPNHDSSLSRSDVMFPPAEEVTDRSHALVPMQPTPVPAMPAMGMGFPTGPEIIHGSFNQTWLMNCLRRRWIAALLLGMLAATMAALVMMWLFPESSAITAYLEVKGTEQNALDGKKKAMQNKELELFQETQKALIRSQFVLKAAISPKAISQLEAVRKESNPTQWLYDGLKVTFKGEILEVSYSGEEDSEAMKKVIDSVIDHYIKEVRDTKRIEKQSVIEKLRELHKDLKLDLEKKIDAYTSLANELEAGDQSIANSILNMLIADLRTTNKEIAGVKQELIDIEVGRQLAETMARSNSAVEEGVRIALEKDPIMLNLRNEQYAITEQERSLSNTSRHRSAALKQLQQQQARLQQEIENYEYQTKAKLRQEMRNAPNESLRLAMTEYISRRGQLYKTMEELEAKKTNIEEQIQQRGQKSGKLAVKESEIEQLKEIERTMDIRLREADVEDDTAKESIRIMQKAYAEDKINTIQRFAIAGVGGIGAFCATCYLIALVEFRRRRLNSATDVDEGLGLRVLGVLPPIASRKAMQSGSPIAVQLSESIDSVRATLMHDSTSRGRQVVLVTSPGTMEGTTTVASHLALSFARAGRRTLLIDGDLREPALHKLFGMPAEDGLSEVLRSELDVADAVRPTNTEGLWLLPSGHCDMDAIHGLATDQLQPIFEKLREEFDFVVIDAPPVLGLADTLSIGQHVDGVILTVLRDHSEVRKIHQASELLRGLGIRLLGSVVNGVPVKADRRIARLHRNQAAKPKKLAEKPVAPAAAAAPVNGSAKAPVSEAPQPPTPPVSDPIPESPQIELPDDGVIGDIDLDDIDLSDFDK